MRAFVSARKVREGTHVGHTYSIDLNHLAKDEVDVEKECLTLQARSSYGSAPPPFEAWFVEDGRLHMPRFYGIQRYGIAQEDSRTLGDPIHLTFEGTLTEVQQQATTTVFEGGFGVDGGALVVLPCGYGKTVWAVHTIAKLGRKACILVHKSFLKDQWTEAFARFCPKVRVGTIQGKTFHVENCDVVIAMIMTLAKRSYKQSDMESFGTICFDECHHVAAPVMNLATRPFCARYVIGLTATKERPDGLTPLLHWCLGPEVFRVERDSESVQVSMVVFKNTTREILQRDGKPLVSIMINQLSTHGDRNDFIATRVLAMFNHGRVILILSDRIQQLRILRALLAQKGIEESNLGFFTGCTKEAQRPGELAKRIVMCSYAMANEGLDKREADTCVMASPKGRVTQCIGRIQRPCTTKKTPLVLDIVDDVSPFSHLRWKRQRYYGKERYEVQVVNHNDANVQWFA